MKLLIDTNVLLDVLLKREPFYHKAVEVLELVQYDHVQEYVSAAAVTDIYYIACRYMKDKELVRQLHCQIKWMGLLQGIQEIIKRQIWRYGVRNKFCKDFKVYSVVSTQG